MKSGKVIRNFTAKDGRCVVLRTLTWEDLDGCMDLINSLVEENADIIQDKKVTREEEANWLARQLYLLERDQDIHLVADIEGDVIASCSLDKGTGISSHTGGIGIIVKKGYRDIGIGTEMLQTLIDQARILGLKMLYLGVFSTNGMAYHVYEKVGFKETGRRSKCFLKNGNYVDDIIMSREI